MSKQLLIYEKAVPVSAEAHRGVSVKSGSDFSFARHINSVPLMAAEFEASAGNYAIVFAGEDGAMMPAAMLGLRDAENLHVAEDGGWAGKYIPAFLRRYPFVFAANSDETVFTLCIDESFSGVNSEGRGERLFDSSGERSLFLQNVLGFLQAYQVQFKATRDFVQSLEELKLLDPMEAQFTIPGGQPIKLGGFRAVNRDRLRQLDGAKLAEFAKSGTLDLIYAHLHSLRNFTPIAERIAKAGERAKASLADVTASAA